MPRPTHRVFFWSKIISAVMAPPMWYSGSTRKLRAMSRTELRREKFSTLPCRLPLLISTILLLPVVPLVPSSATVSSCA